MSASRLSPSNPKRPLTNQPSPAAVYTPKSAQPAGTPTPNPSDSPERAAKRARFEQAQNESSGAPRPSLGQVGRTKSNGRGGAAWVKERVKELEDVYKDCAIAATLYLQYKAYSKEMGLGTRRTPKHLTQRFERSWLRYQSLRSHIEAYLLQCAQSASSPAKSLPTPSSLVPGLPPLPSIRSVPDIASILLSADPHRPGDTSISLDKLAAADPKKGLVGYENGEIVFPGVPSDIAIPDTEDPVIDLNIDTADAGVEDISLSKPLSGTVPTLDFSNMSNGDGETDITNMGLAELTALINGDGFIPSTENGGMAGVAPQNVANVNQQGLSPNTQAATDQLLESLGQYTQQPNTGLSPFSAQTVGQVPQQQQQRQSPGQTAQAVEQMLASMAHTQTIQQPPLPSSQPAQFPSSGPIPIDTASQPPPRIQPVQQQQQQQLPQNPPALNFDQSNTGNNETMDGYDPLADIDFEELAGLFDNASGRSTRVPSPAGGVIPNMEGVKPDPPVPSQPATLPALPLPNPPTDQLGMDLTSLYPSNTQSQPFQPIQSTQGFDDALEGINLDDFDFTDGNMPGVDGDEFESMFAEFK